MAELIYRSKDTKLYQGRWQEVLPRCRPASVDLIVTDPPYGTTNFEWDVAPDLDEMWAAFNRVAKLEALMVVFAAQPFVTDVINSNRKNFRYELIWDKGKCVGWLDANRRPLRRHENCLVFSRSFRASTYNAQKVPGKPYVHRPRGESGHYANAGKDVMYVNKGDRHPTSILRYVKGKDETDHPTQKSQAMLEWIIASYSNPGDFVLDPFAGSGATLVAARKLGRRGLGIEQLPEFCAKAKAKIGATRPTI